MPLRRLHSATLGACILAALAAAPQGLAQAGGDLAGTLSFSGVTFSGDSRMESTGLEALHSAQSPGLRWSAGWHLEASDVVVNWSRVRSSGFGEAPTDPSQPLVFVASNLSHGDDSYSDAMLSGGGAFENANFLVVAEAQEATVEMRTSAGLAARPAGLERWTAGASQGLKQIPGSGNHAEHFNEQHVPTAGQPVATVEGAAEITVRGDFTFVVWGQPVGVHAPGGDQTYPSGAWWENATGPGSHGFMRDEYWQLLRIRATDAVLEMDDLSGAIRWTAPLLASKTSGAATFAEARGTLASAEVAYTARNDSFQVQGRIDQQVAAATSAGELEGEIEAFATAVGLQGHALSLPAAGGDRPAWEQVALAGIGIGLLGLVAYGGVRRQSRWDALLARTHDAIREYRLDDAVRQSERLIRRRPHSGVAWFAWGESRLARDGPASIVQRLEAVLERVERPSLIGFLLSVAYLEMGDRPRARRNLWAALEDERFAEEFAGDPVLKAMRNELNPARKLRDPGASAPFGYA